jgi:hypothetical protein
MGLVQTVVADLEGALDAAWLAIKPKIMAMDATVVSEIAQASETLVSTGFSPQGLANAVTAVMAAGATGLGVLESDVASGIAVFASSLTSSMTAAPSTGTTPPAPAA